MAVNTTHDYFLSSVSENDTDEGRNQERHKFVFLMT